MAHHFDGQSILSRRGIGLKNRFDRGYADGPRRNQGGNDGPDNLDRGVAVGLVRFRIARLPAETKNGVDQDPFDQHEHQQGPLDRRVQRVVGNAGEVAARKQSCLGIMLRTTTDPAPARSGGSAVTKRAGRQAAVLKVLRVHLLPY